MGMPGVIRPAATFKLKTEQQLRKCKSDRSAQLVAEIVEDLGISYDRMEGVCTGEQVSRSHNQIGQTSKKLAARPRCQISMRNVIATVMP